MNSIRIVPRRPAAAAFVILQLVFLLAAAAPRMVWCQRPGGQTVLEFEVAPGECRCEQCALCLESCKREHTAVPGAGTTIRASHCRHNEIDSEAGRSSSSVQISPEDASAASIAIATCIADLASPAAFRPVPLPGRVEYDAGPSGTGALRC